MSISLSKVHLKLSLIIEQVILRRSATSNLFNDNTAEDYIHNFGEYDGDFWLGNEAVLEMTASKPYALMFDLTYASGKKYVEYGGFSLYMNKGYRIHLGVYTGGDLFGECFARMVYRDVYYATCSPSSLLSIVSDDDISVGFRPLHALFVGKRIVQFEM